MATVSKKIADDIIKGMYPEDKAVKIIEYDNAFGGVSYGVVFHKDNPEMYRETDFVINPRLYWSV